MLKYFKHTIASLVYPERNIIDNHLERLKSVENTSRFPKDLCVLITSYAVTIDARDDEKIDKYLPELILKLKCLKDMLSYQKSEDIRIQKQFIQEVIFIYKHRQAEIAKQQRNLARKTTGPNYPVYPIFGNGAYSGLLV